MKQNWIIEIEFFNFIMMDYCDIYFVALIRGNIALNLLVSALNYIKQFVLLIHRNYISTIHFSIS